MASVQAYLEKQSTALLESVLEGYCNGRDDLCCDVVLMICRILARRDPRKPTVEEALREMCRAYLPK